MNYSEKTQMIHKKEIKYYLEILNMAQNFWFMPK